MSRYSYTFYIWLLLGAALSLPLHAHVSGHHHKEPESLNDHFIGLITQPHPGQAQLSLALIKKDWNP